MKTVIILQARMNSVRLPGKVLKTVLGKPLLAYEIERLRRVPSASGLLVATSDAPGDDPVAALCAELRADCFRGSENDVLGRFFEAAKSRKAAVVVRVNGDCPLIDPALVHKVIRFYFDGGGKYDYASNILKQTYPTGMHTEVFSFKALAAAHKEAKSPSDREHVTPFIYANPGRFRLGSVENAKDLSGHRWTVDGPEDLELVSRIISALYPTDPAFGMQAVLALLEKHPDWPELNAHIRHQHLR